MESTFAAHLYSFSTFVQHRVMLYILNSQRMKISLFIAIIFFAAGTVAIKAQGTSKPVKFIENIQIIPGSYSGESIIADNKEYKKTVTESPSTIVANNSIEKSSSLQFKYALILDEEVEVITNFKLYSFIDSWMDTRYRYGGTSQDGIDCSAFASILENNVYGLNIPRTAKEQYDICSKISRANLQEGDLVFFNTRGGVSHVGVYLCNGYFVHSSIRGVTINSLSDDYYNRKFIKGGRISLNNN